MFVVNMQIHTHTYTLPLHPSQVVFDARFAVEAPPLIVSSRSAAHGTNTAVKSCDHVTAASPTDPCHQQADCVPASTTVTTAAGAQEPTATTVTTAASAQEPTAALEVSETTAAEINAPALPTAATAATTGTTSHAHNMQQQTAPHAFSSPLFSVPAWQEVRRSSGCLNDVNGMMHGSHSSGAVLCCGQLLCLLPVSCDDLKEQQRQQRACAQQRQQQQFAQQQFQQYNRQQECYQQQQQQGHPYCDNTGTPLAGCFTPTTPQRPYTSHHQHQLQQQQQPPQCVAVVCVWQPAVHGGPSGATGTQVRVGRGIA